MGEYLERILQSDAMHALGANGLRALLTCLAFGVGMYCLERYAGAPTRQYRSRTFVHDVVLWVVNGSGLFAMMGGAAVLALVRREFPQVQMQPLSSAPTWVQYVLLLVAFDFASYWMHRWQHASAFLWAFHTIHHSQTELSFATTARSHPLEQWTVGIFVFVPIALLLGAQPSVLLPVALAQQFLFALTHSRLDWRFGFLHRVLVSPVFHSLHHSPSPEHHNRNFSAVFSVWDHLFGTATDQPHRATESGLDGVTMPTFWSLIVEPFRIAARWVRTRFEPA